MITPLTMSLRQRVVAVVVQPSFGVGSHERYTECSYDLDGGLTHPTVSPENALQDLQLVSNPTLEGRDTT